jgi:hypothetical protein
MVLLIRAYCKPFLLFDFFVFWVKNEIIEVETLLLHCGRRNFYIVATRDWASVDNFEFHIVSTDNNNSGVLG